MQTIAPFPEKVLQFGTGILLRGLPDYFIDKANRLGIFKGGILLVKSTAGPVEDFEQHHFQFTTCVRGIHKGEKVEENSVNTALSRVVSAQQQWPVVLAAAMNPDLQVIISNTTEVGIRFEPESIFQNPPVSFPGKLTAFLYERFKKLGAASLDLVIIPTELVPDNGMKLNEIVLKLSAYNKLEAGFADWLATKTLFCNSLVDRIVTRPSEAVKGSLKDYNALTIQAEPYKLWAIEGEERVKKVVSFAAADPDVIITPTIERYREQKLRLLNGTHTVTACFGFLQGWDTVYECMQDRVMMSFAENVMLKEILPTLPVVAKENAHQFALDVLDRFRNPYTAHRLLSITQQSTAKMKMRNIPTLLRYVEQFKTLPGLLVQGFAAHLLFMKAVKKEGANYFGSRRGEFYPIQDDQADYFYEAWKDVQPDQEVSLKNFVIKICQNTTLWDSDLTTLPMFVETVTACVGEQ
jgi:tagaturonate reductase